MEILEILNTETLRAVSEPIDRILSIFKTLCIQIFRNNGYLGTLISTIVSQPFLLISVSLILIGFVIGIIKRLISV